MSVLMRSCGTATRFERCDLPLRVVCFYACRSVYLVFSVGRWARFPMTNYAPFCISLDLSHFSLVKRHEDQSLLEVTCSNKYHKR